MADQPVYWQRTVDILQAPNDPMLDRPKLTEKLLCRPPFRFLHDVISAVQHKTGFAPGLFSADELDAHAVSGKEAKVAYLAKVIDVVGLVLGQHVAAKPLKVVAGLEPQETNALLQMLGLAARTSDGRDARVLAGEHQAPPPTASTATGLAAPAAAPPAAGAGAAPPAPMQGASTAAAQAPAAAPLAADAVAQRHDAQLQQHSSSPSMPETPARPASTVPSKPAAEQPLAMGSRISGGGGRPGSARKAPPRTSSAGSGAPTGVSPPPRTYNQAPAGSPSRAIAIYEEGGGDDDSGSDTDAAAAEAVGAAVLDVGVPRAVARRRRTGGAPAVVHGEGVLVRDILAAQAELKGGASTVHAGGGDLQPGGGIILWRQAPPVAGAGDGAKVADVSALRDAVQKLCQESVLLTRCLELLAEDAGAMGREHRACQEEVRVLAARLQQERGTQGETSTALAAQLEAAEANVSAAQERVRGLKARCLRNDETITRLLMGGAALQGISGGG